MTVLLPAFSPLSHFDLVGMIQEVYFELAVG